MHIISSIFILAAIPLSLASPIETRDECVHNTDWDTYMYCGSHDGFPALVRLPLPHDKYSSYCFWANEIEQMDCKTRKVRWPCWNGTVCRKGWSQTGAPFLYCAYP